jgi:hypothetical protein
LPLGVPRFKKLPNKIPEVPKFQSLPASTSEKFESLTKVETYPAYENDSEKLDIDLKGHTIEELAIMANVSVDVIKSAIKLRKQQMEIENKMKGSSPFNKEKRVTLPANAFETSKPWISTTTPISTSSSDSTTQSTTLKTTYVSKKKIKKHPLHNGHKVNTKYTSYILSQFMISHFVV